MTPKDDDRGDVAARFEQEERRWRDEESEIKMAV
jgi:hypothetical protein